MTASSVSTPDMPDESLEGTRTSRWAANGDLVHEQTQFEEPPNFVPLCDFLDSAVQISPVGAIKRHRTGRHGMVAESIYAPAGSKIDFRFDGPVHLLVIYDEGARREGETSIDGLTQSRLHNFANKLTFVPASHIYHEWHETSRPTRITFLYLNPAKLQRYVGVHPEYVPRTFFEDSDLRGTAVKLKSVIESGQGKSSLYSDALVNLLAHELSRSSQDFARTPPVYRGGLISWQMRAVTAYIEDHLDERMDLVTLARLVRLSRYHFSRAFKRSLGVSPRQYHNQRRIERAKVLLGDRTTSITDVGLALGYSQTSVFTVSFRKATGQTPSEFRRNFT